LTLNGSRGVPKDSVAKLAVGFAQMYAKTTEALLQEGVPERTARREARAAATSWLLDEKVVLEAPGYLPPEKPCPLCGKAQA
jgi:hypothetical protein